jgi:hypothetical protein
MAKGREGDREDEDDTTSYYERLQRVQRNEVIPTWRKAPADRDAEPDHYNWKSEGPKDRWGRDQTFEEGQDDPPGKKPRGD